MSDKQVLSIVLIDDQAIVRAAFKSLLERSPNFKVVGDAGDARSGLALVEKLKPDVVILDLNLPDGDGVELCRRIRKTSDVPILMLTARDEDIDKIIGLEVGADDYMTKPFNPRELLARIHAVLRRTNELPPGQRPKTGNRVRFGAWVLHGPERQVVGLDGVVVSLSSTEYALLATFLEHPNVVLTRDQLLDRVKGRGADEVFDRSIDTQISRLRRKLEDDPRNPKLIKTAWGAGYLFASLVEHA